MLHNINHIEKAVATCLCIACKYDEWEGLPDVLNSSRPSTYVRCPFNRRLTRAKSYGEDSFLSMLAQSISLEVIEEFILHSYEELIKMIEKLINKNIS